MIGRIEETSASFEARSALAAPPMSANGSRVGSRRKSEPRIDSSCCFSTAQESDSRSNVSLATQFFRQPASLTVSQICVCCGQRSMGNARASLPERPPISVASLQSSSARGVQAATLPACRPPHDATHRPRSLRLLAHASCLNTALALMVPQKPNQCRQTRSSTNPWESPRFHPTEICSKCPVLALLRIR